MPRYYWLNLLGFLFLFALCGRLLKIERPHQPNSLSCKGATVDLATKPHPFLCHEKIKINQATVADISAVSGISQKGAREIQRYLQNHPEACIEDLESIRGIGPKTIVRLKEKFF